VSPEPLDNAVLSALHETGKQAVLPYFRKLNTADIQTKSSADDYVTVADKRAELLLTDRLAQLLPEAAVIAEEMTADSGMPIALPETGYVWTIDPLDGTRNFVRGDEQFCMMVALLKDRQPHLSCIYRPLADDAVIARNGGGVTYIDRHRQVSSCSPRFRDGPLSALSGSMNAMGFNMTIRDSVRARLKTLKGRFHAGSAGIDAFNVARARSDYVMHSKLTYWDTVPVALCLRELGYHVRLAPCGRSYQPGDTGVLLAACNERIWNELAAFIWSDETATV